MGYRFFLIPVSYPDAATAELNAFLDSHRVVRVDRHWAEPGAWSLCVEYTEGASPNPPERRPESNRGKVDYREVLSPADFAIFARLREARKEIAQVEAVPVYTIFTNEHLAQMVRSRATTRAALARIEGVGEARLDRFGQRMLAVLANA